MNVTSLFLILTTIIGICLREKTVSNWKHTSVNACYRIRDPKHSFFSVVFFFACFSISQEPIYNHPAGGENHKAATAWNLQGPAPGESRFPSPQAGDATLVEFHVSSVIHSHFSAGRSLRFFLKIDALNRRHRSLGKRYLSGEEGPRGGNMPKPVRPLYLSLRLVPRNYHLK